MIRKHGLDVCAYWFVADLQLICGDRVIHNVRNAWDITKFLAEPTVEDIAGHHFNLRYSRLSSC